MNKSRQYQREPNGNLSQSVLQTGKPIGTFRMRDPHPNDPNLVFKSYNRGKTEHWAIKGTLPKLKGLPKGYLPQTSLQVPGKFKQGDPHPTAKNVVFFCMRRGSVNRKTQRWITKTNLKKLRKLRKERRDSNLEHYNKISRKSAKKRYHQNPGKALARTRKWRIKNPDYMKKAKRIQYYKDKKHPIRVIRRFLRQGMYNGLRHYHDPKKLKSDTFANLLGCTLEFFKSYIESKFKKGMTWENRGLYGWHIDHIIPCASFNLTKPSEQKKCFHYTNLQPLWAIDNLKKGNKLPKAA